MAKRSNPQQIVTELIRRGMHREGRDPRLISNALKLWRSFSPKIAENLQQPALWAAAVELAVARLELEEDGVNTRIARKYGVQLREVKAKCDEIWRHLKIKPFDPRFCTLPQILADMIVGDEDLQKELELLAAKSMKSKKSKSEPPPSLELPPLPLDDYVEALLADPDNAYRESDHIADLALDWRAEHGSQSTEKLLSRLINHFGSRPEDGINIDITADALVALGEVLQEEKRFAESVPLFRRAADIHGSDPGALEDLAESQFALSQFVEAIAAWREAIQIEPAATNCHHRIADAYEKLGQASGMVATLEEVVQRQPRDVLARDRLRSHWLAQGDVAKADAYRVQILHVRQPEGIEDITVWVKYQLDAGQHSRAMRFLNRFEEELGEEIETRVYLLRAILLLSLDKVDEAQHEIRRARAIPGLCEHCWSRDLELLAKRFGSDLVDKIKQLAALS